MKWKQEWIAGQVYDILAKEGVVEIENWNGDTFTLSTDVPKFFICPWNKMYRFSGNRGHGQVIIINHGYQINNSYIERGSWGFTVEYYLDEFPGRIYSVAKNGEVMCVETKKRKISIFNPIIKWLSS